MTLSSNLQLNTMIWNNEQRHILNLVKQGKSVFFSGPAGSGKSHLLKTIIQELRRKHNDDNSLGVLSSTGISAINIGGTTLHSYFRIGTGDGNVDDLVLKNRKNKNWLRSKAIIIDEISMVDGVLFDKLEVMARTIRGNELPFGGLQLILSGDFYQLPPVQSSSIYCFESSAWTKCINDSIILKKIYRQKDEKFVGILTEIRNASVSNNTIRLIKKQKDVSFHDDNDDIEPTKLFSRNKDVDDLNNRHLNLLEGEPKIFKGYTTGNEINSEYLVKNSRCPKELKLKTNAQVMLLKNIDTENGLANGLKGIVVGFQKDTEVPMVHFENKSEPMPVSEFQWDYTDPIKNKVTATYNQIPLTLCWACTIHKSQGSTISKLVVDCAGIFSFGQLYVALSRAQTWNKLKIINFRPQHIKTDPKVIAFYDDLNKKQEETELILDDPDKEEEQKAYIIDLTGTAKSKIEAHFGIRNPVATSSQNGIKKQKHNLNDTGIRRNLSTVYDIDGDVIEIVSSKESKNKRKIARPFFPMEN